MSGRGAGRGKGSKKGKVKGRGGGHAVFVSSAEELAARDKIEKMKQDARRRRRKDDDDEDGSGEDHSSNEEVSDNDVVFEREEVEFAENEVEMEKTRKAKGVEGLIDIENPNMKKPQTKVMKAKDMSAEFEQKLSRREREAIEKENAAADYRRRHLAGETKEAKKDLQRLQDVRKRREEAEKRKQEIEAAAAIQAKAKKAETTKDEDEPLDARAIKALKPQVLKEYLKARNLDVQGQKKDLQQRLIDYENARQL